MRRKDREVKDKGEIEDMIGQCRTCHLAMTDGGAPYVVPMSFGCRFLSDGGLELYFHSAHEGKKIDILRKNGRVCFEMASEGTPVSADTPCSSGYYFASVIGYGEAIFVEDAAEKCEALSIIFRHQTGKDAIFIPDQSGTVCVFKVVSKDFTGKRKLRPDA